MLIGFMMELKHMTRLLALLAALAGLLPGCAVARPFSGPAVDAGAPPDAPVTMVITHAVVDRARRRPFDDYTRRLVAALDAGQYEGLVGFSVRKELLGDEVWTVTVWSDPQAMQRFAGSELHRDAMRRAGDALRSVEVRHVQASRAELPWSWERVLAELGPRGAEGGT